MLMLMDTASAAERQGRRRFSGSDADFGVWPLEPRVLLTASGADWMEPLGDAEPVAVQQEQSDSAEMIAFSMAWDEPVATPTDLTATAISSTEIRLTWSDNSHNESGFGIWKWISGRWRLIAEVGANATQYVDAGLAASTTYLYQVHAFNEFNSSAMSASASGTTVPLAPTGLTATAVSSGEIELTWNGSSGATGYQIERSLDGITGWMLVGTTDPFTWEMTDSGLDAGTTYHYRVMAVNAGGLSGPSGLAAATTEQAPVHGPAAPMNLAASVFGHKHVRLTWGSVEHAIQYVIERSDNGGEWTQISVVEACMTEFKDHWVSLDGSHAYRVRTVSDSGMSVPSDEAIVTTGRPLVSYGKSFSAEPIGSLADDDEAVTGMVLGKDRNRK